MNALTDTPHRAFPVVTPRFQLPVIGGVIDRRMLVNFRCNANVLASLVPPPFRLKLVRGFGMAGICLIRLRRLGPRWLPGMFGLASENTAHRIAVEWDEAGKRREGVFIPRRDTNSRLNALAGGRLFAGVHHHANFKVWENSHRYEIEMDSDDGRTRVRVAAQAAEAWSGGSVFTTLDEASQFFQAGSLGWSARNHSGEFDGLELHTFAWKMEPLSADRIESSLFDDRRVFAKGASEFDSAFLMRGIEHEWHGCGRMICNDA